MPQIMMNDFSGGWRPSDDIIGGPINSLVRMQNLKLDEIGALTLVPGSSKCNTAQFSNSPHSIYSKILGNTKCRFVGTSGGEVLIDRGITGTFFDPGFGTGGSPNKAVFGSAYNMAIICSGSKKVKYDPTVAAGLTFNLGPGKPTTAPTFVNHTPYTLDMTGPLGSYGALEGAYASAGGYGKISPDPVNLNGVAALNYGSSSDSTNLSSGSQGTPEDLFSLVFQSPDTTFIKSISVIFRDFTDSNSYFSFTWDAKVTQRSPIRGSVGSSLIRNVNRTPGVNFNVGSSVDGKLQCHRGDFTSVGQPKWTNLGGVAVSVECLDGATDVLFKNLIFSGGSLGPINGDDIQYVQVNICDRNGFTSYSAKGPETKQFVVSQGSVTITPQDFITPDVQNTGYAIFRRGGTLGNWFQVKSVIGGGTPAAFDDNLSDEDAITIGITLNQFLQTVSSIGDAIIGIVGPFFNRMLYFTWKNIYISQDGNPEMYATNTGVLSPYGNTGEIFMWAEKFGNSAILIGTSNDIYELTGTFAELPDGTIDASIRPTGCKNPPVNDAVAASANSLYYIASDGIRKQTAGNEPFWPQLDLLWKQITRYGIVPPIIRAGNQDKYALSISKNELYLSVVDNVGARKMWVYDLLKNYCYEFKSDDGGYAAPIALFTEEDGNLLAAFTDSGNKYLRVLNTGNLIDGTTNPVILMRTKSLSGEAVRNRKDSYTLKLKIDTGASGIEVKCYKDESANPISLGFINTSALVEQFIDLSSLVGVCKSYQIEIAGNAPRFKLTDFTIDFELRPAPLSYFRSQPSNFGVQGRKRFYEIPITIDTLGSPVRMTPIIDNVPQSPLDFTTTGKTTISYKFNPLMIGTEISYTLLETGGVGFEYYGDVQPRVIEALPDAVKTLYIPATNLGTGARKRLISYAFEIDTNGKDATLIPYVDGVPYPAKTVNTLGKRTYIYYFDVNVEGTDISGLLTGSLANTFEFYGLVLESCVSEKLPASATSYVISTTNLGTYARKRFITFAFVINTKGKNVKFTPYVDGVPGDTRIVNTTDKRTYVYYFETRTEGIDIGGTLFSVVNTDPFEFYAVDLEECVSEKLPSSADYLVIPYTNFGIAAAKRIRAIPLVIDTRGNNVIYTPIIDGVLYPPYTFNTTDKRTVLYYFTTDAFGIDIGGTLVCQGSKFEFYGIRQVGTGEKPEIVEAIPVGKLFDQLGPVEFLRSANIKGFRVRMIAEGISFDYKVYIEDRMMASGTVVTLPNVDKVYEVPWVTKFLNGTTCRIEISAAAPFHRYGGHIKASITGSTKLWTAFK